MRGQKYVVEFGQRMRLRQGLLRKDIDASPGKLALLERAIEARAAPIGKREDYDCLYEWGDKRSVATAL